MPVNAKKLYILFVALLISILGCSQHQQSIADIGMRATVGIEIESEFGNNKSLGSGFFIDQNQILTNYHVIENGYSGHIKLNNQDDLHEILGVLAYDKTNDLALLSVNFHSQEYLKLGNSDAVKVAEEIYALGSPSGLEGTFSNGIVSGLRSFDDINLIQITAPISRGSSGGPVLNKAGLVIGVAVGFIEDGQNLNFAIPINEAKSLIKDKSGFITLESLSRQYQNPTREFTARVSENNLSLSERVDWYIENDQYEEALELLKYRDRTDPETLLMLEKTHLNYGLSSMSVFVPSEMHERMNFALAQFIEVLNINPENHMAREQIEQILMIFFTMPDNDPKPTILKELVTLGFDYNSIPY